MYIIFPPLFVAEPGNCCYCSLARRVLFVHNHDSLIKQFTATHKILYFVLKGQGFFDFVEYPSLFEYSYNLLRI